MRKAYDRSVDAEAAVHAWLEAWDQAWRAKDPDALANAVRWALRSERHPQLREAMQVYGRQSIAQRVLRVYRRLLVGGAAR